MQTIEMSLCRGARAAGLAVAVLTSGSGSSLAADAATGESLVRRWCAECHLVEPGDVGSDVAKPFGIMANDPAFTLERLRRALTSPHPPMPEIQPSRDEIDAIFAYIESLREK